MANSIGKEYSFLWRKRVKLVKHFRVSKTLLLYSINEPYFSLVDLAKHCLNHFQFIQFSRGSIYLISASCKIEERLYVVSCKQVDLLNHSFSKPGAKTTCNFHNLLQQNVWIFFLMIWGFNKNKIMFRLIKIVNKYILQIPILRWRTGLLFHP